MIVDLVAKDLIDDHVVTVRRFGTLSPYVRQGYRTNDLKSSVVRRFEDKRLVKFHPHDSFSSLLLDSRDKFSDKGDDVKSD